MQEALAPYGTLSFTSCHAAQMTFTGPWGDYAIPTGTKEARPDEYQWLVLKVDVLRLYLDLTQLDEDSVQNVAIFSLDSIHKHERHTPYKADTPSVSISMSGLNSYMLVHTVDLDKLDAARKTGHPLTEKQMGVSMDGARMATILFADQQHADVFQKAIQKTIIACKAGA